MARKKRIRKRAGQPKSRKGIVMGEDFTMRSGKLTLRQVWKGPSRFEMDPRAFMWPMIQGALRAFKQDLGSTPSVSEATAKRRRQARGWRAPPGPSSSNRQWVDSGFFRNTMDVRWRAPKFYEIRAHPDRVQTAQLLASLRKAAPIFGNVSVLRIHPEFVIGVGEANDLLLTEERSRKRTIII